MDLRSALELTFAPSEIFKPVPLRLYNTSVPQLEEPQKPTSPMKVIRMIDLSKIKSGATIELKAVSIGVTHSPVSRVDLPVKRKPRERPGIPETSCKCLKSQCLKLYCECFAAGNFCGDCSCERCLNTEDNEIRDDAVKGVKLRNPLAYRIMQKKGKLEDPLDAGNRGCNCSRSECRKKYCECFALGVSCGYSCRCVSCKNK